MSVTLTENNVRNLVRGKPIQLKHSQLIDGKHRLNLHPLNHKKLMAARSKGKGLRLTLTQPEINEGEGFKDIWNKVKQGAKWVKNNVIDSSLYQSAVKPIVRKGVDTLAGMAEARLPIAAPLIQQGVQKLSDVTNAFGINPATATATAPLLSPILSSTPTGMSTTLGPLPLRPLRSTKQKPKAKASKKSGSARSARSGRSGRSGSIYLN